MAFQNTRTNYPGCKIAAQLYDMIHLSRKPSVIHSIDSV